LNFDEGIPICQGGSFNVTGIGLEGSTMFPTPQTLTPPSSTDATSTTSRSATGPNS
jgi:hypothetical protein